MKNSHSFTHCISPNIKKLSISNKDAILSIEKSELSFSNPKQFNTYIHSFCSYHSIPYTSFKYNNQVKGKFFWDVTWWPLAELLLRSYAKHPHYIKSATNYSSEKKWIIFLDYYSTIIKSIDTLPNYIKKIIQTNPIYANAVYICNNKFLFKNILSNYKDLFIISILGSSKNALTLDTLNNNLNNLKFNINNSINIPDVQYLLINSNLDHLLISVLKILQDLCGYIDLQINHNNPTYKNNNNYISKENYFKFLDTIPLKLDLQININQPTNSDHILHLFSTSSYSQKIDDTFNELLADLFSSFLVRPYNNDL